MRRDAKAECGRNRGRAASVPRRWGRFDSSSGQQAMSSKLLEDSARGSSSNATAAQAKRPSEGMDTGGRKAVAGN